MYRFLTFMKLKPRFHMDPNAPHCYSVLPSLPDTIPAQGYLCGLQCLHLCWEQDLGGPEHWDIHSQQCASCSEQCGVGTGCDSDGTCQHQDWELIRTKERCDALWW